MRRRLLIAATLAIAGCSGGSAHIDVRADLDDIALASAVEIHASGCHTEPIRGGGSGIIGGYVLTAAHVVAGATSITVRSAAFGSTTGVAAHLVAVDPANDLALLAAPGLLLAGLPLGKASAGDLGVAVIVRDHAGIAAPFTISRPVSVRILDIYQHDTVTRSGYQVAIEIEPGDSGAVLVGPRGDAVGVLYARSQAAENRAWATSTSAVPGLLQRAAGVDTATGIDPGPCAG
ncbi:unannotated protein [freshwater metagenome]|uniref:Unannotated protein n=1 Tax=freshwater metagenome TaxID=449393 RepID=A0A6J7EYI6_9ZZZZ|nr:hypothetical protein [Actinomycetota bacterium]